MIPIQQAPSRLFTTTLPLSFAIVLIIFVLIAVSSVKTGSHVQTDPQPSAVRANQPTQKFTVVLSTWDVSGNLAGEKIVAVTDNLDDAKSAADSAVSSLNPTFYTSDVYLGTGAITMSKPFDTDAFGHHLHSNGGIMRYDASGVPIYGTNKF